MEVEWTPFEEVVMTEEMIMEQMPWLTPKQLKATIGGKIFVNSRYQVCIREGSCYEEFPALLHLSIKRNDKETIHDWRDLQRIKNELVGLEHEGVELYPADSRLVDAANQYHMYVLKDPNIRWPFGFQERLVRGDGDGGYGLPKQRPFNT